MATIKIPSIQIRKLNAHILEAAKRNHITVKPVKVHSSDVFYTEPNVDGYKEISAKHGCACVEMESFALLHNANVFHKKATCLLTISDSMPKKEHATAAERQTSYRYDDCCIRGLSGPVRKV